MGVCMGCSTSTFNLFHAFFQDPKNKTPSYVLHGTGIFTYMNGLDFMANVGKYSMGGAYYGMVCFAIESLFNLALSQSCLNVMILLGGFQVCGWGDLAFLWFQGCIIFFLSRRIPRKDQFEFGWLLIWSPVGPLVLCRIFIFQNRRGYVISHETRVPINQSVYEIS